MDKSLKSQLKEFVEKHPKGFSSVLNGSKNRELKNRILEATRWMNGEYNMATRIYSILHDLTEFPKCKLPSCHNTMEGKNVISLEKGWYDYCSTNCAAKSEERNVKVKATSLERYGSTSYLNSKEGRKRYDAWCHNQGVDNPFQLDWVNKKRGETMKHRYGAEFTQQVPELVEKCKETCLKHFGTDHQWKSTVIQKKNRESTIKRFGTDNVFDIPEIREKQRITFRTQRYESFLNNGKVIPLFSLNDFIGCENPNTTIFKWKCIENGHNHEFESVVDQNTFTRYGAPARCWRCHPSVSSGHSNEEKEVVKFLKANSNFEIVNNTHLNRTLMPGMEIDILVPEKKIGIEFDGLYYHSDTEDSDNVHDRHLNKTEYMESIGWKLIHIFEDEWLYKRKIVESRLLSAIGCNKRRIYARSCNILEIDSNTSKKFMDDNHLQGDVSAGIRLGLYHKEELVAVMTFGKPRFNGGYEYELLRYASACGTQVVGGAGKLLKHFEKTYNPKSLISYADRRWSNGNLYKALGFELIGKTAPNYFYVKGVERFNRVRFQKHKLKNILENFDKSKTEKANMFENGYRIIYDSGNLSFSKRYNLTNIG